MLVSLISMTILVSAAEVDNPAYEAQLEALVGRDYRAAVEMLGIPEARDLRDVGGEVWTFRTRRGDMGDDLSGPDSEAAFASRQQGTAEANGGLVEVPSASAGAPSGGSSGGGSGGSSSAQAEGSSSTGLGYSATRRQADGICTTRIALDPDGTVAGYTYVGRCYPR